MRLSSALSRDFPMLEGGAIAGVAAGSAADAELVLFSIPDLTHAFLPSALNEGIQGNLPINSVSIRLAGFISGAAANTVGNATNNYVWYLNAYRKGVLQGSLAYLPMTVNTTCGTAVAAAGVATITPASMAGIVPGMPLLAGTSDLIYVISTTATTLTANFGTTHAGGDALTSILVPWREVDFVPALAANTLTGGSISAGANQVVTPTSMLGIHVGDSLLVDTVASLKQETVVVSAVTATTFTATFANAHTGSVVCVSAATSQFALKGGDVVSLKRTSNNVTGLASPVGVLQCELVPSVVLR